ncbi:hypothetical protein C8A01DRAFT_31581 [Parachaetomium inaequale]|uniref:Transcription factor domain-containing protein n=1 Tax=Parachaetomium inaequale TaxID=2588326 RepID=A0AAN6PNV7_9PEZI|nr:hypothetical protein C8A01DRAFT_31581 [Parachaetomium inaequale]
MSHEAAEDVLQQYRQKYVPCFPFVPIPAGWTAHHLSVHQPVLFAVIVHAVAAPTYPARAAFHKWFRQCLAQEVVGDQRKTLEMLQAILVFTAWGAYYLCAEPRGTDMMQLAMSLLYDLGLNTPPAATREHTLQEQRAALGCFYICSGAAPIFRQAATPTFTPYMNQCCERLAQLHDEPSDSYLAGLVRMQLLASRWAAAFPPPELSVGTPDIFDEPTYRAMTSAFTELERISNDLPDTTKCNPLLWTTNSHALLVRIASTAIYMQAAPRPTTSRATTSNPPTPSPSPSQNQNQNQNQTNRTSTLQTCLTACLATVTAYLTIPPSDLATTCPVTTTCSLALALLTLRNLLLLPQASAPTPGGGGEGGRGGKRYKWGGGWDDAGADDAGWDFNAARQSVDFAGLVGRLCERFEEAYRVSCCQGQGHASEGLLSVAGGGGGGDGQGYGHDGVGGTGTGTGTARGFEELSGGGAEAGPAVLGYWKKLKWLKEWYLSEAAAAEASARSAGADLEHGDELLDSRLLEITGEYHDDAWLSLAGPEDLLSWAIDTW